jgi:hypothetical protein
VGPAGVCRHGVPLHDVEGRLPLPLLVRCNVPFSLPGRLLFQLRHSASELVGILLLALRELTCTRRAQGRCSSAVVAVTVNLSSSFTARPIIMALLLLTRRTRARRAVSANLTVSSLARPLAAWAGAAEANAGHASGTGQESQTSKNLKCQCPRQYRPMAHAIVAVSLTLLSRELR